MAKKWIAYSWAVIFGLSIVNLLVISLFEGFIEGKAWTFLITLIISSVFVYRNFFRK